MTNLLHRSSLVIVAVALVFACSSSDPEAPRAGSSCAGAGDDVASCDGAKATLICRNGVWTSVPCAGAEGCSTRDGKAICDMTIGQTGAVCLLSSSEQGACSLDGMQVLSCVDGKFVVSADCAGVDKCRVVGDKAVCDQTITTPDAPCITEGSLACSTDGTKALSCAGGKFVVSAECAGATKCRIDGGKRVCDQSLGTSGAPCLSDGNGACSTDQTQSLTCTSGKFVVNADCGGPTKCQVQDGKAVCDQSISSAGAACSSEGGYACSTDGKTLLKCSTGKFAVDDDCAAQDATCKVTNGAAGCTGSL